MVSISGCNPSSGLDGGEVVCIMVRGGTTSGMELVGLGVGWMDLSGRGW